MTEMKKLYDEAIDQSAYVFSIWEKDGFKSERYAEEDAKKKGLRLAIRVLGKYEEYRAYAKTEEAKAFRKEMREFYRETL